MKKLLFISFIFYYSFSYGQDTKVSIKIDTIAKDMFEITASKNELSKKYLLYDETSRKSFITRLKTFYSKSIDSLSITIDKPFTLINIKDLKKDLEKSYDLNNSDQKKEFKEKLITFYNQKEEITISELNKRLKIIENDTLVKEVIGNFKLKIDENSEIPLYKINGEKNKEIKIKVDSISLSIKDGNIYEVYVRSKSNDIYVNNNYPTTLELFSKENSIKNKHKIYKNGVITNNRIYLSDILSYKFKVGEHYIPKNTIISINLNSTKPINIEKNVDLNSYTEAVIYTDIFGLLGDEVNSPLQTEFSTKFLLNTRSIRYYYGFLFNYVQPKVKYSKFSDENKYLDLNEVDLNNIDIKRRSYLELDLKLNIFKGELGNRYGFEVNGGATYSYTKAIKDSVTHRINLFETYGQFDVFVKVYHNFGLNANIRASYVNHPRSSTFDLNRDSFKFNWFISPEIEIYYYPIKDKKNKLFLRFQYVADTRSHSKDFSKLQFGYKIPIKFKQKSDIIK